MWQQKGPNLKCDLLVGLNGFRRAEFKNEKENNSSCLDFFTSMSMRIAVILGHLWFWNKPEGIWEW